MVRSYKPKNRYCRRTKITEPVFLAILRIYARGHSVNDAVKVLERWCRRSSENTVSRQAINGFFLKFGKRLWEISGYPFFRDRKAMIRYLYNERVPEPSELSEIEDARAYIYANIDIRDMRKVLAELSIEDSVHRLQGIFDRRPRLFERMVNLSKAAKGLPPDTFGYELTRALVLHDAEYVSDFARRDAEIKLYEGLKASFLDHPL